MPTLRNLEENLKKKPIKLNLGTPALTAHPDENGVMQGDGVKRRGRPKKIPQADPPKLLKALDKRLKAKQLAEEKKALKEAKAPKKAKEVAKDAPSNVVLPSTYKPSTTATIKVDLPAPDGPLTRSKPPPKRPVKPKSLASFTKTPTYQKGKKGISPIAPTNLPTHTPTGTPVTKLKPGIEKLSGSRQEKRLQRIAEDQAKDAQKQLLAEVTAGKQLKPTKKKPLPSQVLEEVKAGKPLTKVGKRKTKAEKEAEEKSKPAQQQAEEAIEAVKKVLKPKKKFEVNPPEEEDEPIAELPNKRVLVVERNWAINHPEAMAEKPPDKGSRGNKVIDPALIAWYKKYPEAPQSIKWMKTTVSGQTYLAEHPEFTLAKGKAGRPTKEELASREKAKSKKASAPAETEAVKAYEERHTPTPKPPKPSSPKSQAERKDASKEGVKAFAKALSTQLYTPTKPTGMLALAKKKPKAEEPPSREIPVAEDAKATAVKANSGMYGKLSQLPLYDPDIDARLDLSPEEKRDMQRQRDLPKITATGPGIRQIAEQRKAQAQEELEDEIDFLTEMYGPETALRLAQGKGEGFRRFQGKGILNEDSDSDKDSSDSDVSDSGDEDESLINIKQCFNKGSGINISHNTIMPMSRPVGLHPALESSTMTMNPGAYNNIKPLMGHLMGGAVSSHIRRTEHMGRTMSHYGDHHSHPQMSPIGHYTKHIKKGGPVVPTMDDLIHHGVEHLKTKFGSAPDHAHNLLHTALHTANIPKELHPMAHYGLTKGLKSLVGMMGGNIGGSFWNDLGSRLGHAFTGVGDVAKDIVNGRDLKDSFSEIGDIAKDTAYSVGDDIKAEAPGLLKQTNEIYNDPNTQRGIRVASTALSQAGMPELGIPLSVANVGISNALDAGANKRDVKGQLENRYLSPAKSFLKKFGIRGMGAGNDLAKNLGHNVGRLADSGSDYLIRQMDGHGVGNDLAKNLGHNVGRLADSGSDYLIRQMDGHGLYAQGGKVGDNLAKNLASNVGRLADSGSDYLIRQMDGHGCGGEIGDGLYAQGRGVRHPKGSQEAKDHMAKLRAMKGKGVKTPKPISKELYGGKVKKGKRMKGGAMPPPSRSPVTNEVIAGGLYA